ncbi:MAG: glycosyltransferase family 39 protein, partial [Anaerolineae bacterium]|nr:glycosyltransferase family 39 protein [Anaerolineae bacterium]
MSTHIGSQPTRLTDPSRRLLGRVLTLACLLALFAQLSLAIPKLSMTYDEPIYTAIGYADWTTKDFYWHGIIGHGPLVSMWATWPLLIGTGRMDVTELATWGTGDSLGFGRDVLAHWGSLETLLFLTRYPIIWLTLILAAAVTRWARQLQGERVAALALVLFAFEPNVIAHGQVNTTDMGVTTFGFISTLLLAAYLRRKRTALLVGTGVTLGAAIASKASGLFWVGTHGLIVTIFMLTEARVQQAPVLRSLVRWGVRLAAMLGIALVTLWAVYGFETGALASGRAYASQRASSLSRKRSSQPALRRLARM